ncbi:MAG: prolipoprotein diacylglyceryl transferase [Ruminococcus sp.]|nr:prolipoprotein diacylglyceryl transferase [Ruminococcus sp.]
MTIHIDTDDQILPFYMMFILSAILAGMGVIFRLCSKRGIALKKSLLLSTMIFPMSIVCALLFTFITSGGKHLGIASTGAAAGAYAAVFMASLIDHRPGDLRVMLQNCTFALPLMYGTAKIGCFTAGCCHGISYNGFLSVKYSGSHTGDINVFPVQLVEAAVFLSIFIAGIIMLKKHDINSVRKVIILSAAAKFSLEFLRESHLHRIISIEQAVCLLVMALCIINMKMAAGLPDKQKKYDIWRKKWIEK